MPIPSYLTDLREREVQLALQLLRSLPSLTEASEDDFCPICLIPYSTILEEHAALKREQEAAQEAGPSSREATGVVRLSGCGHIFCYKDLAEWVESQHGSCPACRQTFFEFTPIDEAEYESSDGGEYMPGEDEEEDGFTDDGDFELIPTSDFEGDTDMDEEESLLEASDHGAPTNSSVGLWNLDPAGALQAEREERQDQETNFDISGDCSLECDDSGYFTQGEDGGDGVLDDEEAGGCIGEGLSENIDLEGPYYTSEELSSEGSSYITEDADADISMTVTEDCSSGEEDYHAPIPDTTDTKSPGPYAGRFGQADIEHTQ